ncbi:hypothetical protein MJT46_019123 [Ovis ammon polii x Ovis aries]|nr:hypothetical protein MJT46_019123 [Ovis ammon polii x Ovis aries]
MQGTQVRSLVWEDPHVLWSKLRLHTLLKPVWLQSVLCNEKNHRSEKPKACTARETQHNQKRTGDEQKRKPFRFLFASSRQTLVCRPMSLRSAVLQLKQQGLHTLTDNDEVRTEWGRPRGFMTASR